jgi:hypothetical protein
MNRPWITVLALAAAMVCATPANADKDKDKDKDKHKGNPHADRDDGRWERREGYEYGTFERGTQPPGWSKGKKTGWGNCGMPPGQAKKYGCRAYTYNGRTHYYYQDEQGRMIVRRPAQDHDRH